MRSFWWSKCNTWNQKLCAHTTERTVSFHCNCQVAALFLVMPCQTISKSSLLVLWYYFQKESKTSVHIWGIPGICWVMLHRPPWLRWLSLEACVQHLRTCTWAIWCFPFLLLKYWRNTRFHQEDSALEKPFSKLYVMFLCDFIMSSTKQCKYYRGQLHTSSTEVHSLWGSFCCDLGSQVWFKILALI